MRKAIIALPLIVGLSACQTVNPGPVVNFLPQQVQQAIQTACGVVLTAESLAKILPFANQFSSVLDFANNVCSSLQVTTANSRNGKQVVVGVFHGRRISGVKR